MPIKNLSALILCLFGANSVYANLSPEVIGSCKNQKSIDTSVTFTKIIPPEGLGDDESRCLNHAESTEGGLNFGSIICNDESYLILKGNRINLNSAVNHSMNPSITPGAEIAPGSEWSKISYNNNQFLCIGTPLSSSGQGGDAMQYYIVENAFNNSTPEIYYYFFNQDIMPVTASD